MLTEKYAPLRNLPNNGYTDAEPMIQEPGIY